MSVAAQLTTTVPNETNAGATCSRIALTLALILLTTAFLLISPPPGQTYPGAIPWSEHSLLKPITDAMSLGGLFASERGVEIKDLALHLAAAAGLVLLGVHMLTVTDTRRRSQSAKFVTAAQLALTGWVLLSLASSLWAGDADMARGQALIYTLGLAWAVALANTLQRRHLPALLTGLVTITAIAATLCIWYYHERNPGHRPGFPLGNPSLLAAALLPALLICGATLCAATERSFRERRMAFGAAAIGALAAMLPLFWCATLTRGRGALLALIAGLALIVVLRVGRRLRWLLGITFATCILAAGAMWFSSSSLDVTMSRGASMRFRIYAWRYAAEMWQARPYGGHGAGAYPRLAGQLAFSDRALDPEAFMAELVEHAHNELFEVLTEIGLVGGVLFVAGLVAILLAVFASLKNNRDTRRRWLVIGLAAAGGALLADSMVGVMPRLPGGTAIVYTLLGLLWCACRETSEPATSLPDALPLRTRAAVARALICFAAAAGAGGLAIWNWTGVQWEMRSKIALADGRYEYAVYASRQAQTALIDPVRIVVARDRVTATLFEQARSVFGEWLHRPADQRTQELSSQAIERATNAHESALRLRHGVPALTRNDARLARTAEWLSELSRQSEAAAAAHWTLLAEQAWQRQRQRTPYDVETLLALTRYRATMADHVALLRDALRLGDTEGVWLAVLKQFTTRPRFEETLATFVAAAGPVSPQTSLDSLVLSMAPETQRLAAAWHALRGEFNLAARRAAAAASLYKPMGSRFPTLYPTALREQAKYLMSADVNSAESAAKLLREALAALPSIQAQKYATMARPYRLQLATCLLVSGKDSEAEELLRDTVGAEAADDAIVSIYLDHRISQHQTAGRKPPTGPKLARGDTAQIARPHHGLELVGLARGPGRRPATTEHPTRQRGPPPAVSQEDLSRIRHGLCQEFPSMCDSLDDGD